MSRSASLTDSSDGALLELSREGTDDAFGELWRRHWGAGQTVARSITSAFDPDDLVQEAFTRVYTAVRKGGGPTGAFRPYLFTTIRNTAASWGGKRRETSIDTLETFEDPATNEAAMDAALDRGLTTRAFHSLPTRWQEVLWYSEVEQMAPAAIAPLLGMKANSVAALAYRAREGLRQAWIQAHIASAAAGSDCRWSLERMGAYTRGGLGTRDTRRMEMHLDECARCTIVAAEAHEVGSRLALVLLPLVAGTAGATGYLAWLQSGSHAVTAVAMPAAVTAGSGVGAAGHIGGGIAAGTAASGGAGSGTSGSASSGAGSGAAGGASTGTIAGFTIGGVVLAGAIAASVAAAVALSPGSDATSTGASDGQSSHAPSAPAPSDESDRAAPSESSDRSDEADDADGPSPSDPTPPQPRNDDAPPSDDTAPDEPPADDAPPAEPEPPAAPPQDEPSDSSSPPASDDDTPADDSDDDSPAAPTITAVDTGEAGVLYPLITGTAEPGSTVSLRIVPSDGGDPLVVDDVAVDDDGSWKKVVTDDDGLDPADAGDADAAVEPTPYEVTATADRDGDVSDPTDAASFDLAPLPSASVADDLGEIGDTALCLDDCTLDVTAMPNAPVIANVSRVLTQGSDEYTGTTDESGALEVTIDKPAFVQKGVTVAYDVADENADRVVGGAAE